jgi:hypothetical protein
LQILSGCEFLKKGCALRNCLLPSSCYPSKGKYIFPYYPCAVVGTRTMVCEPSCIASGNAAYLNLFYYLPPLSHTWPRRSSKQATSLGWLRSKKQHWKFGLVWYFEILFGWFFGRGPPGPDFEGLCCVFWGLWLEQERSLFCCKRSQYFVFCVSSLHWVFVWSIVFIINCYFVLSYYLCLLHRGRLHQRAVQGEW